MRARRTDEATRRAAAERAHLDWWQWLAALAPRAANVETAALDPADRARGKRSG